MKKDIPKNSHYYPKKFIAICTTDLFSGIAITSSFLLQFFNFHDIL